ncbi:hypothetical protein HETIRDRAFT_456026 [Heterobasidion irregulare TC 32-1]|uniref:DUF6534 domain-containing protein n=1 Tax=Heterobasidion irregulare (strain TC 32-1) TaxID=747525 RepID=W4JRC2_HETIT|nr:uncharacterized protein HETIRDRAFT_456026 [Heterobasidion irregulare TC 32-1]ETW75416.1 hypothetical protein HETIRDRAFT_456026 [Heterobasidion irregulare TC 32-1]
MAPLSSVPPDIALIQGPLLLGYLFGYGLFGVLVVQMYFYHLNFPKDHRWMKTFVWIVFSAEILLSVFSTIAAWQLFAEGWGDLDSLVAPTWSFTALPSICGFTTCSIIVWLASGAACDVMITAVMVRFLIRASSSSHWMDTKDTLNKLIKLTVETGMITAFGATIELILFWAFHQNNVHFILYSNTILATLNARAGFRGGSSVWSSSAQGRSVALWEDSDTALDFSTERSGTTTTMSVMVTTTRRTTDENGNEMQMVVLPQSVSVAREASQIDDASIHDSKKQVDSVD